MLINGKKLGHPSNKYSVVSNKYPQNPFIIGVAKVYSETNGCYKLLVDCINLSVSSSAGYKTTTELNIYSYQIENYYINPINKRDYNYYRKLVKLGNHDDTWRKVFFEIIKNKFSNMKNTVEEREMIIEIYKQKGIYNDI